MILSFADPDPSGRGAVLRRQALGRMVFILGGCLLAAWPKNDPAVYLLNGRPPLAWAVMLAAGLLAAGHYMLRLGNGDYSACANRPFWWVPLHRDPHWSEPRPEPWAIYMNSLLMAVVMALPLLLLCAAINSVRGGDMGNGLAFIAAWALVSGQIGRFGLLLWPGRPSLRWAVTRMVWAVSTMGALLVFKRFPNTVWPAAIAAGLAAAMVPADILLQRRKAADKPTAGDI